MKKHFFMGKQSEVSPIVSGFLFLFLTSVIVHYL